MLQIKSGAAGFGADFAAAGGFCPAAGYRQAGRGGLRVLTVRIWVGQANIMRFWQSYRVMAHRLGAALNIPRHAGSFAVIGFLGGAGCLGLAAGGHGLQALRLAGSGVGLGVDKVEISGNKRVSEIDVLQALGLEGDSALPALSLGEAQTALNALPWVERAELRKIYPDRLAVALRERQPFALWQSGGAVSIIDSAGRVIVPYNTADGRGLPLFVGAGAAEGAAEFLRGMAQFPDLAGRARAYIRVAGRRWDIVLDNGQRIKLPAQAPFAALAAAEAMEKRQGLFSRDVESVDLRLGDRVTVALGAEAMARRAAAVAEDMKREKALKAANGGRA